MGITANNVTFTGGVQVEAVDYATAPTIGTASRVSGSGTQIDITYTASSSNGGLPITSYTATSTPGSITGTLSQASSGTIRVSGLTQGTAYTFVVYATTTLGNSPNSAASNSIIPAIVPTAPTIGTVIRVSGSSTELDVPYTASSSNGGLPITSYTATSTPGSITGTISQASSGTIRVSGLTQGTNYTFVVKATNAVGDSPNSAASNSLAPAVVPTAPTVGTVIRVSGSGTSLDIPYTASSSNGGNAITSYTATSTPGSITGTLSQASSGTIRVSGLTQGTNYTFVVKATNAAGDSPNSAASNSLAPAVVPTAPTIGTVVNVSGSATSANVPYTASSSDGGNAITSYTATSTPGSITGTISQASSGTITVTGLTQGTQYTFVVKATNAVGDSPNSAASNSIYAGLVASAPTIGTAIRVSGSGTQIDVPYTASSSNGGSPITTYTAVSTPGSITGTLSQASSGTIRVSGLTQGTSYTFVVYATNSIGNSPNSAASNSIAPAVVPTAPTIGTPLNVSGSGTSIDVPYTAGSNGGNAITSYTAVSTPGSITGTLSQASSGTIRVAGLTQGTSYTFVVYATNSIGNSPNSAASSAITPGTVATAPTIGTATVLSNTSVSVSYTASSSNGGLPITSYTAVSTPGGITGTISQASSGTITVTGLTTGTSYTFVVYATNSAGNSPNSAASNAVVPASIPAQPTISSIETGFGTVAIAFTAPSNGGAEITSHTAISYPDNITTTVNQASSGTILVSGGTSLIKNQIYTFTVYATNGVGNSIPSTSSSTITYGGTPVNESAYTQPGTFTWVAPAGVSNVSVVAVGAGGGSYAYAWVGVPGGSGGALGYKNNIAVTAGNSYTVVAGAAPLNGPGGDSYFISTATVKGGGGFSTNTTTAGTYTGDGGGNGGVGNTGCGPNNRGGGGGGAGGYSGTGGTGGKANPCTSGTAGSGGAGGGGGVGSNWHSGAGGGGVGLLGAGPSGAGGAAHAGGGGGSGGANGGDVGQWAAGVGGAYGGGAGGGQTNFPVGPQRGGYGAVRIVWGSGRSFPSTNVTQSFPAGNVPDTPTIGTVTTSLGFVTVPFTAAGNGGNTITSHRAISTPGNVIAVLNQASSGNIVYMTDTLLTQNTSYTFKVYAVNSIGAGPQSPASNSITYPGNPVQEAAFTVPGTYTWFAPNGVTSVSAVAVGGGGAGGGNSTSKRGAGGAGGALAWINAVPVSYSTGYTIVVGAGGIGEGGAGGQSYFANTSLLIAYGGGGGSSSCGGGTGGSTYAVSTSYGTYGGGGGGSSGQVWAQWNTSGGGGAGGYSGSGGGGGPEYSPGGSGSGGAGGGGAGGTVYTPPSGQRNAAGGGGVGIYGEGASGAGGAAANGTSSQNVGYSNGGGGGSNGSNGALANSPGGLYGGGGGGGNHNFYTLGGPGGNGAVRIVWGTGRSFPSTNVGQVSP